MKRPFHALFAVLLAPLLTGFAPPDPVPLLAARGSRLELAGALAIEAMAYEDPAGPGSAAVAEETASEPVSGTAAGRRTVRTFRPRAPGAAPSRIETVWTQERESDGDLLVRCRLSVEDTNGLFHATPRPDGSLAGVCVELRLTGFELGGGSVVYGDETTRRDEQGWEIRPDGAPDGLETPPSRALATRLRTAGRRLRVTVERGGEPLRLSESGRFSFAPDGTEDCRHVFRFHALPDPERPGTAAAEVEFRLRSPSPESLRLGRAEEARNRAIARLDLFRVPTLRLGRISAEAALARLASEAVPAPGAPDDVTAVDRPALRLRPGEGPLPVIDYHGRDVPLREALCELADLSGLEIRLDGGAFVLEDFDPHVRHLGFRMGTPEEEERIAEAVESRLRRTVSPPAAFRDAPASSVLAFLSDAAAAGDADGDPPPRFALRLWQTVGADGSIPPDPTRVTIDRPQGATLHELVEAIAAQNRLLWSVQRRTVVLESLPE